MPITSKQIRAARALLNLSQKELAEKAELSVNSLNNIEREVGSPRVDSMHAIRDALVSEGIEFLDRDGVRFSGEQLEIEKVEGPDVLAALYEEMLKSCTTDNNEVLIMGKDNSRFHHYDHIDLLLAYKRFEDAAIKNGIRERAIFLENDTNFLGSRNHYRWIPKELFAAVPMTIYSNNVAIILWGPPVRMIIIRNPGIATTFRHHFEAVWMLAKPVSDDIHRFHYETKMKKILDDVKKTRG